MSSGAILPADARIPISLIRDQQDKCADREWPNPDAFVRKKVNERDGGQAIRVPILEKSIRSAVQRVRVHAHGGTSDEAPSPRRVGRDCVLWFNPHPADQLHIVLPDRREGNSRFDRFQSGFEYPVDERTRQGRPAVRVGFEPASEHDLLAPRPRRFQHVERVNHAIGRNVNRRVRTDELGDAVIERAGSSVVDSPGRSGESNRRECPVVRLPRNRTPHPAARRRTTGLSLRRTRSGAGRFRSRGRWTRCPYVAAIRHRPPRNAGTSVARSVLWPTTAQKNTPRRVPFTMPVPTFHGSRTICSPSPASALPKRLPVLFTALRRLRTSRHVRRGTDPPAAVSRFRDAFP